MPGHAGALLNEFIRLWEAEPAPSPEERLDPVAQALAAAARRSRDDAAGLWLQRLEEAAHGTWLLIAAEAPGPAAKARPVPFRAAA